MGRAYLGGQWLRVHVDERHSDWLTARVAEGATVKAIITELIDQRIEHEEWLERVRINAEKEEQDPDSKINPGAVSAILHTK